ncbi:MAG TPA: flagellar motor protein, partial [Bdellovibrionales bacterium]|nr:flagellar motor protein [Bdellovibrionales bacterium]
GGSIRSIMQGTAALIVVGGTAGAVLVSFTLHDVTVAMRSLRSIFVDTYAPVEDTIREIVRLATKARRQGIISLEDELSEKTDIFLRKSLAHAVDGAKPATLRDLMELEIVHQEEHDEAPARVFEAAGGYSPTMGILGAVLGLIQVMEHLNEPEQIGGGIAIAFVATVYGVGAANLIFLPIGNKLKRKIKMQAQTKEMILTGALGIVSGLNPFIIEEKLRAYVHTPRKETEA